MKRNLLFSSLVLAFGLFAFILISCQGHGRSESLNYDETINDEQQVELLKSQANAFVDSIKEAGYDVLGIFVDEKHHSVFYARKGLSVGYSDVNTRLLPILRKNIKTGKEQAVQIPSVIDGHSVKANLLLRSWAAEEKILLLSTSKNSSEIQNSYSSYFRDEPIDVFILNVTDLTFHYVTGGRHWQLGQENHYGEEPVPFLACYDENIRIPLSQIFDGSFRFEYLPKVEKEIIDTYSDTDRDYYDDENCSSQEVSDNATTRTEPKEMKVTANKTSNHTSEKPAKAQVKEESKAPFTMEDIKDKLDIDRYLVFLIKNGNIVGFNKSTRKYFYIYYSTMKGPANSISINGDNKVLIKTNSGSYSYDLTNNQ